MPIEITRTQESHSYDRSNNPVIELLVTWYAGKNDGPYTNRFPADASASTIRMALEARAREIDQLRQR